MSTPGLSFKLEIALHTILCIRQVYPPNTFTRRRAHGVPVYQSRHPQVCSYISEVVAAIGKEMEVGRVRRVTVVVKQVSTGLPMERFIIDLGYLGLDKIKERHQREAPLLGAPLAEDLSLMLRGFLIRLVALDSQLEDNRGETTFGIILETDDDLEPSGNKTADGSAAPWVPALASDTLQPASRSVAPVHHEPLLNVKAVETGVIDIRLMVQECIAKTGLDELRVDQG
ncbi:DNA-binding protein [Kockovaella imperatae]|uniref:DNA-binding protein n=1 Tax=Kockovaella imperatae TaxID=4999 RepID=A0A1Y1UGQ6_9TREE|nr:DNA-binding protein [Kockovaella imperatae]ORX37149.1 DNA-binding protein [Kockovaella imperatae]